MFARIKRKLRLWLLADDSPASTTTTTAVNDDMIKLAPYIKSDSVFVNGNAYHGNSKDNSQSQQSVINSDGIRFTVYRANGGTIIETNNVSGTVSGALGIQLTSLTYPNTTSNPSNLYVVSNDEDLGSAINKIITLHNLTK